MRLPGDRKLLCCGLVVGDPHIEGFLEAADAVARGGADVLEWVLPIPDAAYHGRVMHRAANRALKEVVTLEQAAAALQTFHQTHRSPVVLTSYYARVLVHSLPKFAEVVGDGGFSGVMVPDLPVEECEPLRTALTAHGVDLVQSLGGDAERRKKIFAMSQGFALWASHAGGETVTQADTMAQGIRDLSPHRDIPIFVAAHVQSPDDARKAWGMADGLLVGSSVVWLVEGKGDVTDRLYSFVRSLSDAR